MPFISYAQNFEDIMLWRALKHVSNGFYIDVGANDPTLDSITRAFYDRGWHGINIEPMQQYQDRLRIERTNDINLAIAVGDTEGELTFYDIEDTGLSTMDAGIAAGHAENGKKLQARPVQLVRLDSICRQYVNGPIHFLKVDVEGFESAVLRGMDFKAFRPWILVIEATLPQTQTRNTDAWQALVVAANYRFAYFDGLNDFYVAAEHAELMPAFSVAPNYFDDFTLRMGHFLSAPVTELEHELSQMRSNFADLSQTLHEANVWGHEVDRAYKQHREQSAAHIVQLKAEHGILRAEAADAARQHGALSARLEAHAREAAAALADASAYAADLSRHNAHLEQLYHQTAAVVAALYASTSWRITRPIRIFKRWASDPRQALVDVRRRFARAAPLASAVPASAATGAGMPNIAQHGASASSNSAGKPVATIERGKILLRPTETGSAPPEPPLPASVLAIAQALQRAVHSTTHFH